MILFGKKTKTPPRDKKGAVTVIIAAAGSGSRLGGVSKPLMLLCGRHAIEYSLDVFSSLEEVTRIIISTRSEDIAAYEKIVADGGYSKVSAVIEGGSTRQESVTKAFRYAFSEKICDFVAIHDAARPLITEAMVSKAFSEAREYGCAVCASLCPDTVKRSTASGFVGEAVDRDGLYLIGTPQIFSYEIYQTSVAVAEKDGFEGTDDSSVVEHAGFKVKLCETSRNNIKITYPGDAELAEMIIGSRGKSKK